MALTPEQIEKINAELVELNEIDLTTLIDDQKLGHYRRVIELATQTVAEGHKELTAKLINIAESFNEGGEELPEIRSYINSLPDEQGEDNAPPSDEKDSDTNEGQDKSEGDDKGEDPPEKTDEGKKDKPEKKELKTPVAEIRKRLKDNPKIKVVSQKIFLRAILKDNDIKYRSGDNTTILGERLVAFQAGINYKELEEPAESSESTKKTKDPKEHTLERAKELVAELSQYIQTFSDQRRAKGLDVVRYNKFVRELNRKAHVRLV